MEEMRASVLRVLRVDGIDFYNKELAIKSLSECVLKTKLIRAYLKMLGEHIEPGIGKK